MMNIPLSDSSLRHPTSTSCPSAVNRSPHLFPIGLSFLRFLLAPLLLRVACLTAWRRRTCRILRMAPTRIYIGILFTIYVDAGLADGSTSILGSLVLASLHVCACASRGNIPESYISHHQPWWSRLY